MLINPLNVYTYKDYLAYDEDEKIKIVEGEIFNISPAPSRIHQEIIMEISYRIKKSPSYDR